MAAVWEKAQVMCQTCPSLANSGRDGVSQERCVPQEELLALLGLQKGVVGHFMELKPVWGQALWQACTCIGFAGLSRLILSFSAISGLCKVHLSNFLS